jgi:methylmalonyl-CoA mutase, C-terminal domain
MNGGASMGGRLRVLIAKPGLDGHDRGAKVVALALRDAGVEVIYTGLHQEVERIAAVARAEAVDVVALSVLSGAHLSLTRKLVASLDALGIRGDLKVVVGGAIPPGDVEKLLGLGVARVFPTGTPLDAIVTWFRGLDRRSAA